MSNKDEKPRGRIVRVSRQDNRLFKQILLDLYDLNIFRSPDELADELFSSAIQAKTKELRKDEEQNNS